MIRDHRTSSAVRRAKPGTAIEVLELHLERLKATIVDGGETVASDLARLAHRLRKAFRNSRMRRRNFWTTLCWFIIFVSVAWPVLHAILFSIRMRG